MTISKRTVKIMGQVIYWLVVCLLLLTAGFTFLTTLDLPINYKLFVVQSHSMEPKIKRMAVVVVQPQEEYQKGEVITTFEPSAPEITLTHRIHDIEEKEGKKFYITKGDANEDPDTEKKVEDRVLGKVILAIPLLGYLVSFVKTQTGLIVLVVIPAVIIIYSEILKIKSEILRVYQERKKKK